MTVTGTDTATPTQETSMNLTTAIADLGALHDRGAAKASLGWRDLAAFLAAAAAIGAPDLAAKARTDGLTAALIEQALMLGTERLAREGGLVAKASLGSSDAALSTLETALRRVQLALRTAQTTQQLVRNDPTQHQYRVDLGRADNALKAALGDLAATMGDIEATEEDRWVKTWLEHGRRRAAKVASEIRIARGYWA